MRICSKKRVAEAGLERSPDSKRKTAKSKQDSAKSDVNGAAEPQFPPDLQAIIEAWATLSENTKAEIVAMVRAAE